MEEPSLTFDEVKRMAEGIGMTRLTNEHLQQLLRATRVAQARRASLPVAKLGPADEPAHVFRMFDRPLQPSSPALLPEGEGNRLPPLSPRERGRE
ncbi:MAG: hypothetical protein HY322_22015 [Betaproteobacteria bacterium]|nr:hypothetical protein [Betaproteobacteria bacterium]